jgi:glutamate carboxypeptidase
MTSILNQNELQEYLTAHLPEYLTLLQEWVGVNSFTTNLEGIDTLGRITAVSFSKLGFQAERILSKDSTFGSHLVMTRPGKSGRIVGLVSHLDTVFPHDEEIRNNFAWREAAERIYGPGTVDIKGGTLIIYMMMAALQALAPEAYNDITWVILLDSSEEVDGNDFSDLCIERLGADALACLIFEGGSLHDNQAKVVVARKGMAIYRIEVEGKASHAGSAHERGANAICQLADVIQQVCHLTDYDRDLTFNVGRIEGGTVTNRVPHFAAADVEMRAFTPQVYDAGVASMLALDGLSTVESTSGEFPCHTRVSLVRKTKPWPRNAGTDRLFTVWQEAGAEMGVEVIREERGGLSDGNYFWDVIPSIDGLGAAGGNAHCSEQSADGSKEQEYCLPTAFVPKAVLNITAVLKLINYGKIETNLLT